MWQPITLRIKNLFTHEETVFNFILNEMILLLGVNEDEDGGESNGSGKSVILDAFILALTGDIYRDGVNKDEYIRKGQNSCVINLFQLHSITKETMIIHREIFIGNKGSTLDILINEKSVKDFSNQNKMKRNAQEFIYDKIGISKEDIQNFFCIGEGNDSCFLTATDTKQKEVISRFSNYSKIDKIVEKIKDDLKENEKEIYDVQINVVGQTAQKDNLIETIESLKNDEDFKEKKESLNEQLQELQEIHSDIQQKRENTFKQVNSLQLEIKVLKKGFSVVEDIITLNKKLKLIRITKDEQEEIINDIKEIKSQLSVRGGKMLTCPKCKWQFIPNDNMTVKELEASKEHVQKELEIEQITLGRYEKEIVKLKEIIATSESLQELESRLSSKKYNLANYDKRLIEGVEEIVSKKKEIQNLKKNNGNEKLIKQQQEKLKICERNIEKFQLEKEQLEKKRESLNFHRFAFEKQFRNYISNKTIRTIQDIINFYLNKFQVSMQVHILGYTMLKSGELREKIQIWVIKNGRERILFKALSKGQRGRVALCSCIALNRLLNNSTDGNGLAFLGLDEFLEGLDKEGQLGAIKIMQELKMTSILIMHHSEDISSVRNKRLIFKKDGISKLENIN